MRQSDVPSTITVPWDPETTLYSKPLPAHTTKLIDQINCGGHTWRTEPELPFVQIKDIKEDGSATLEVEATSIEQVGTYQVELIVAKRLPSNDDGVVSGNDGGVVSEISYPLTITIQSESKDVEEPINSEDKSESLLIDDNYSDPSVKELPPAVA